jgi:SAM-dependent methyltransferase
MRRFAGHIVFNLNDAQNVDEIESVEPFDLIVFGEVIEHLYTAPELVLGFLSKLLSPGGLILCQTPNAVALSKRVRMFIGTNPYQRIRINTSNPGHFREYTREELMSIGERVGLRVVMHQYKDYFGCEGGLSRQVAHRVLRLFGTVLPSFRAGQTIVYRRP